MERYRWKLRQIWQHQQHHHHQQQQQQQQHLNVSFSCFFPLKVFRCPFESSSIFVLTNLTTTNLRWSVLRCQMLYVKSSIPATKISPLFHTLSHTLCHTLIYTLFLFLSFSLSFSLSLFLSFILSFFSFSFFPFIFEC